MSSGAIAKQSDRGAMDTATAALLAITLYWSGPVVRDVEFLEGTVRVACWQQHENCNAWQDVNCEDRQVDEVCVRVVPGD